MAKIDFGGVVEDVVTSEEFSLERAQEVLKNETVAVLQGFCPVDRMDTIKSAAAEHGWGIVVSDPEPEDAVPTQIRYPRLIRPIKAVFDLLQISPGYREADISSVFLLFFSLLYAYLKLVEPFL